jgi:hypothetical protein
MESGNEYHFLKFGAKYGSSSFIPTESWKFHELYMQ